MVDLNALVADLVAESEALDRLVAGLPESAWAELTPAAGWTIAHQISHLAWTDQRALLAATDADAFTAELTAAAADLQGFVDLGAAEGAALAPAELLNRWRAGRDRLAAVLLELPSGVKFPWYGPPMGAASTATARLMETWAHGQDVYDAVGVRREPTARLRHVAHLAIRTRDFAHRLNDRTPPTEEFRVELTAPDGELWSWGPASTSAWSPSNGSIAPTPA